MTNPGSFMGISPHLQDEQVALYVDALKLNRTEELPENIRGHVALCQTCKKNVMELYTLMMDEDYSKAGPHPYFDSPDVKRSWFPREFIRLAAAILALVGVAVVAYYISVVRRGPQAPPRSPAGNGSVPTVRRLPDSRRNNPPIVRRNCWPVVMSRGRPSKTWSAPTSVREVSNR